MAEQTDWEIPEAAKMMRDAADTIWSLRSKYNDQMDERDDLRVENARLCEKVTLLEMDKRGLKACYDNLSRQHADLEAENAKLREFVQAVAEDVYGSSMFSCDGCRFSRQCYSIDQEKEHKGRGCQWHLWSRELGVEVS